MSESLRDQLDRLAGFIIAEVPGEPSRSQGAIDTAIRVIRDLQKENADLIGQQWTSEPQL